MAKLNREWIVQAHGKLVDVDDGIMSVQGSIAMPLGKFPRRMTVITLQKGGTLIWSPVSLGEAAMKHLLSAGPVRAIVVPNRGHRLDLAAWAMRFPDARIFAPPGSKTAVGEAAKVNSTRDTIGDAKIRLRTSAGLKENEFTLQVERKDGVTLLLNDMLANVRHPQGIGAKVMARLFGFGVSRPQTSRVVQRMFVEDRAAVAAHFRKLAAIPRLRRIIPSHGEILQTDPAGALLRVAEDFDR
jgi:hypothetical protein